MGKLNDGGLAGTGSYLDFGHRAGAPAHVPFSFKASRVNITSLWFSSSPAVRVNRTDRSKDTACRHGTGGIRERPESHAGSPHMMSILCLYIPERNPMRPAQSGQFLTRMVQLIRGVFLYTSTQMPNGKKGMLHALSFANPMHMLDKRVSAFYIPPNVFRCFLREMKRESG